MAGTDLYVKIGGDSAGLTAATKQASKAIGDLDRSLKGVQSNARGAVQQTQKITDALVETGEAATRSASQVAFGRRIVTQNLTDMAQVAVVTKGNLGSMASVLPDLVYGLKQMGLSLSLTNPYLLAITATVAAGVYVWNEYAEAQETVKRRTEEVKQAHEDLKPTFQATTDLLIEAAANTGKITEEEAKRYRLQAEAKAQFEDATKAARERIAAMDKEKSLTSAQVIEYADLKGTIETATDAYNNRLRAIELNLAADKIHTEDLENQRKAEKAAADAARDHARALEEQERARLALHRQTAAPTAAKNILAEGPGYQSNFGFDLSYQQMSLGQFAEDAAAGVKEARALKEELYAANNATLQLNLSLAGDAAAEGIRKMSDAIKTFEEAVKTTRDELINLVQVVSQGVTDISEMAVGAAVDRYRAYGDEIAAIDEKIENTQDESRKRGLQSQKRALQKKEQQEKEAALKAFKINKTAALVQAGISTSLAIVNAAATVPFVPAGIIAMVAAGVAGAVQIAAIASQAPPQFHSGGLVGRGLATAQGNLATGVMANVLPGEGVVTRRGMDALGQDGLESLNQGGGAGGPTTIIYSHQDRILAHQVADLAREGVPGFRNQPKAKAGRVNLYAPRAA